jgi:hypothetical protein
MRPNDDSDLNTYFQASIEISVRHPKSRRTLSLGKNEHPRKGANCQLIFDREPETQIL